MLWFFDNVVYYLMLLCFTGYTAHWRYQSECWPYNIYRHVLMKVCYTLNGFGYVINIVDMCFSYKESAAKLLAVLLICVAYFEQLFMVAVWKLVAVVNE